MKLAINIALSLAMLGLCLWLVWPDAANRRQLEDALRHLSLAEYRQSVLPWSRVVLHGDRDVAQDLLPDAIVETGHHGKHDNQRSDTQSNPGNRNKRNHGNKGLLTLGSQVTQADKKFVVHYKTRDE